MGSTNDHVAWILVGQAARIAIHLGLDQPSTTTTSDAVARCQHVFLGCFVLDTMISARLGRAPLIPRKKVHDIGLLIEEGLEEWQPWVGCQGFGVGQDMKLRSPVHALSTFNRIVRLMLGVHEATSSEGSNLSQPADLRYDVQSARDGSASLLTDRGYETFRKHPQRTSYPTGQAHFGRPDENSSPLQQLRDIHQEIIAEMSEERGSLKGVTTPPALILQIASHCAALASGIAHDNAEGHLSYLMERYAEAFGVAGMPPVFHTFVSLARSVRFDHSMLDGEWGHLSAFDSAVCALWDRKKLRKGKHELEARHVDSLPNAVPVGKEPTPIRLGNLLPATMPSNIGTTQSFSPIVPEQSLQTDQLAVTPTPWQSMPNVGYFAPKLPQLAPDVQNAQPAGYDGAPLERFNSAGSVDLDALFDELASLDGADRQDNQPQFMQNLGFAPNIDLNDFLASDYGQFDPLLSAYAQQSTIGPPVMDQDAPSTLR